MTISTIVIAITGIFGGVGGGRGSASPPKDEETWKKWLSRLADALKSLAGKAAEAFPAILGSVIGAILRFLGTAVVFVTEKTWTSIFLLQGLFGVWLIQKNWYNK